jgi:hypothetical protein
MSTSKHLDKIGIIGLLVVAPLCLEICEVAKALEILGISFSTARGISIVLLGLFLGFSPTGIISGYHEHHRGWTVALGLLSSAFIVFFDIVRLTALGAYLSCAGFVAAGIANLILRQKCLPAGKHFPSGI